MKHQCCPLGIPCTSSSGPGQIPVAAETVQDLPFFRDQEASTQSLDALAWPVTSADYRLCHPPVPITSVCTARLQVLDNFGLAAHLGQPYSSYAKLDRGITVRA